MPVPPPIDLDRFKQTFNTGDKTRYKKFLIWQCQKKKKFLKEIPKNYHGEFLNNHIGYEKGEDGKFPKVQLKDIKTILFNF